MATRKITYKARFTNEAGGNYPVEITVRASDAKTGAEIATQELRAVIGPHSRDTVYSDQVVRIEAR